MKMLEHHQKVPAVLGNHSKI